MDRRSFFSSLITLVVAFRHPSQLMAVWRKLTQPEDLYLSLDEFKIRYIAPYIKHQFNMADQFFAENAENCPKIGETINIRRPARFVSQQNRVDILPMFETQYCDTSSVRIVG